MKKLSILLSGAALTAAAAAHADVGSENWFNDGVPWYEHPCGFDAFTKYGKEDTAQNRHSYYETLRHPEMCAKLFP
jgi:hypothetical protein